MDCSNVSAAERVCDCDEGVQCPNERNPIFFMWAIYGCPGRIAIVEVPRWWKAFTIRPNPLELSQRLRYILPIHTTCLGCPESAVFTAVFGVLRRGAENPSLSATLRASRASGRRPHRSTRGVGCKAIAKKRFLSSRVVGHHEIIPPN
jgi:hypothetical protein